VKVRDVNFTDLKQIMKLEFEIFKENAFSRRLMVDLIHHHSFFLKIVDNENKNKLIGFIIAIRDKIDRVNIINFIIDPKYQNKGYGTYLLKSTIERISRITKIKKVILNVQVSNLTAIKLYEKFNFKKNPNKVINYYPSGESAYFMELEI
jgi:ribosomal-protein-alanine N-acetyltransferase